MKMKSYNFGIFKKSNKNPALKGLTNSRKPKNNLYLVKELNNINNKYYPSLTKKYKPSLTKQSYKIKSPIVKKNENFPRNTKNNTDIMKRAKSNKNSITKRKTNESLEKGGNNQLVDLLNFENFNEFTNFAKNDEDDLFFLEEPMVMPPEEKEFKYSPEDNLGKVENNQKDYLKREEILFIEEKKPPVKPESEPTIIEDINEDLVIQTPPEIVRPPEVPVLPPPQAPPEPPKPPEPPETEYIREKKEKSAKKIQEIFRAKRKERLYMGFDSTNYVFLKIYVNEYDANRNVKSIEVKCYYHNQEDILFFTKTIRELLDVESIPVNEFQRAMGENIINKILLN